MNWKFKAAILKSFDAVPGGARTYRFLQSHLGRISDKPEGRLPMFIELAQWLQEAGRPIAGATFFEVGTGHLPTVPVCLSLLGAEKVITVDLYQRLDYNVLRGLLNRLASDRGRYDRQLAVFAPPPEVLKERFDLIEQFKDRPREFMERAGIVYLAPCDAANTGLAAASIDCHLSVTVFEHVPANVIAGIMREANRILKDDGLAIHFIDPSDHFQHQDSSIGRSNFLRYSEKQWQWIAGNQFAYTNRLRRSDLVKLFEDAGFDIIRQFNGVDPAGIPEDFPLDEAFSGYDREDLATITVRLLAAKRSSPEAPSTTVT